MQNCRWVFSSVAALIVGVALPVALAAQGTGALPITAQVVTDRAPAASQVEVTRLAASAASFEPGRQFRTRTDLSRLEAIRRSTGAAATGPGDADLVQIRVDYLAN